MEKMMRFLKDEDGVTAIEYGLIASLIAVVIIASATIVGTNLNDIFIYRRQPYPPQDDVSFDYMPEKAAVYQWNPGGFFGPL